MKTLTFKFMAAVLLLVIACSSCSSSKGTFCGCPNEHGFVGYK